jgi:hypothetical protein
MRINHRRRNIRIAEQFLHRANCTLSRRHSMILMPVPYNRLAISHSSRSAATKSPASRPDSTLPAKMQDGALDSARLSLLGTDAVMLQANFVSDLI